MLDFDAETRPARLEGAAGRYTMVIPRGWEGGPGVPYGGWTTAVALRAAGLEAERARPASLAAQFLRPLSLAAGLIDIEVEVLRRGRRAETIRVALSQHGKLGVHALVTSTDPAEGLEYEPERSPKPISRDGMVLLGEVIRRDGGELPEGHHIEHYEYRVPDDRSAEGIVSADGKRALVGWIRYGNGVAYDDPWVEAARYCVPADTQVPAAFLRAGVLGAKPGGAGDRPFRGTTLDLLLHFHRTEPLDRLALVRDARAGRPRRARQRHLQPVVGGWRLARDVDVAGRLPRRPACLIRLCPLCGQCGRTKDTSAR